MLEQFEIGAEQINNGLKAISDVNKYINNSINSLDNLNYYTYQIGLFYRPVSLLIKNLKMIKTIVTMKIGQSANNIGVGIQPGTLANLEYNDLKRDTYNIYNLSVDNVNYEIGRYNEFISYSNYETLNYETKNYVLKSLNNIDLLSNNNFDASQNANAFFLKEHYLKNIADSISLGKNEKIKLSTNNDGSYVMTVVPKKVRYVIKNSGNDTIKVKSKRLAVYAESEANKTPFSQLPYGRFNSGINYGSYDLIKTDSLKYDIIAKTNYNFISGKYDTLIARFHTENTDDMELSSANSKYGLSHGRNLLKNDNKYAYTNFYSNPYCRVWTFHHQYHKYSDLIRPFDTNDKQIEKALKKNRTEIGHKNLTLRGCNSNMLQIAPTSKEDIMKCMFSIENLAWKGENNNSINVGPLGGRIMWFPPYGISFNENVSVQWNSSQFIGRGENIYTYTNTERSGTLNFKMLIDHPSIVTRWSKENTEAEGTNSEVDDIKSKEQTILRFFAGCDILDGSNKSTTPKSLETKQLKKTETVKNSTDEIHFYVYFPNNYSGIDDWGGSINPIDYLLNGVGCNLDKDNNIIPIKLSDEMNLKDDIYLVGGYELHENYGLSLRKKNNKERYIDTVETNDKFYDIYGMENDNGTYWNYRIDSVYMNQKLEEKNYLDSKSFNLNSHGYLKIKNLFKEEGLDKNVSSLFSFLDFYLALNPSDKKNFFPTLYSENKISILSKLIKQYEIDSVSVTGYASGHGYANKNKDLGNNRAKVVRNWLMEELNLKDVKIEKYTKLTIDNNDINSLTAKLSRCAKVSIKFKIDKTKSVNNSNDTEATVNNNSDSNNKRVSSYEKVKSILTEYYYKMKKDNNIKHEIKIENNNNIKYENNANKDNDDDNVTYANINNENEYEYFKNVDRNMPILRNKIVDKIKYFDPAFHSITPEGFNARLTFLHQCTRQGNTLINSTNNNATNLSFGRPPICVLRIGDFFNTKIIIDSLSINYNDSTWDLNDEGIGVMPMIADISINFKFIGGSDLSGPISRLQNAISFNYYANTSVYDNRSDILNNNDNKK